MKSLETQIQKAIALYQKSENPTLKASAVVGLIYCKDELILIRRSMEVPKNKGDLAFIGGHINSGESYEMAMKREFTEETAVSSQQIEVLAPIFEVNSLRSQKVIVVACRLKIDIESFLNQAKSNGEWVEIFPISFSSIQWPILWSYSLYSRGHSLKKVFFCDIKHPKKNLWGMTAAALKFLLEIE